MNPEQFGRSKRLLKRLLCYESQHQSQSNEKSLVQFDYEKAVSNYLGTQSTFNQPSNYVISFTVHKNASNIFRLVDPVNDMVNPVLDRNMFMFKVTLFINRAKCE